MQNCKACSGIRIISVNAKCSDMCMVIYPDDHEEHGYVPIDLNIGGDDYLQFDYCADCGKIVSDTGWPLPQDLYEKDEED